MEGRTRGISRTGGGAALRALLALVLAIGLMPAIPASAFADETEQTPAANDENMVAQVGDRTFESVKQAIDSVQTEGTVTLLADVSEGVDIPKDKAIIIKLNGHGITVNGDHAIEVHGTLTVEGTGTVKNEGAGSYAALAVYPDANVELNGGAFQDETWYTIKNLGTLVINEEVTVSRTDPGSSLIDNGWYGNEGNDLGLDYPANAEVSLTINGGAFSGGMNTVKNDDFGVLVINGGEFSNTTGPVVLNWNETTINDGSFTGTSADSALLANGYINDSADKGQFEINGGTFKASNDGQSVIFTQLLGCKQGGKVSVSGGEFVGNVNASVSGSPLSFEIEMTGGTVQGHVDEECIPDGMTVDETGKIVINEETAVAKVGDVGYTTLDAAIKAAPEDGTVVLLKDVVLDATGKKDTQGILTISKDITINGNGREITAENVVYDSPNGGGPSMINVQNGAEVRFVDLVIDGEGSTKHGINMNDGACVELENVTIENNRWYAVVVNESSLAADGLQTSGNDWGINVDGADGESVLTISDSTIGEGSSIVLDGEKVKATVESGSYHYVVANKGASTIGLTVGGGTFDTNYKDYTGAVNIANHVADGLKWNPVTGAVEKPKPPVVEPSYDVTIAPAENGAVTVDPKAAKEGDKVTVTVKPDAGFEFVSLVVADEDGNALKLELNADGTYSFEMPAGDVAVHAAFECDGGELCPSHAFTDVDQEQWYHAAIDWAVDNDVLQGVGDGLMLPDGDITRAQMAQVLWNVEGQPAAAEGEGFSDVSEGDWFAGAVAWASQEGIFVGYDGAFDPDAELTREQAATVLMRWAESNGEDVSGRADLSGFPDADGISEWAVESVRWAVDAGVLEGVANPDGTTTVSAQGTATRAQVAALMMRLEGQRTA